MYRKLISRLALVCCSVLLPLQLSAQESQDQSLVQFLVQSLVQSLGQPLVSYNQSHPLLAQNTAPMVQVFESGAVKVNRPPSNKRSGSYQFSITDQMVAQIKMLMASSSGVEAAVTSITQEKADARSRQTAGERTLTIESDPTTTIIAVNKAALQTGKTSVSGRQAGMQVIAIESLSGMSGSSNKPSIKSMRELELLLLGLYQSAGK